MCDLLLNKLFGSIEIPWNCLWLSWVCGLEYTKHSSPTQLLLVQMGTPAVHEGGDHRLKCNHVHQALFITCRTFYCSSVSKSNGWVSQNTISHISVRINITQASTSSCGEQLELQWSKAQKHNFYPSCSVKVSLTSSRSSFSYTVCY